MKSYLIGLNMMIIAIFLISCSSDEVVDDEKVEFDPTSFIDNTVGDDLRKMEEDMNKVFRDYIRPMDYVSNEILVKDGENDYYYTDILSNEDNEIIRTQLLYMEVHRDFMKYLYDNGYDREYLMAQNRLFNKYINVFEGRKYPNVKEMKTVVEQNFKKYNIEELDTIVKGEDLISFVGNYRKWEDDIGYHEWFKEEADFKEDVKLRYDVAVDKVRDEEYTDLEKIVKYVDEIDEFFRSDEGSHEDSKLHEVNENIREYIKDIEDIVIDEERAWVKDRSVDILNEYIEYIELYLDGDYFKAGDKKYLVNVKGRENRAFIQDLKEKLYPDEYIVKEKESNEDKDEENENE